jgi:glycosyltransferase involved in cell wall biosynthesis
MGMPPSGHKVSVLIPTYNCAATIRESIDSVLNQTYQDFEIIVVDDGSTDNTKALLEGYGDRVRYFYQDNAGATRARLHGLHQARGEYIAIIDADDIWLPDKLKLQVDVLDASPPTELLFTDFQDFSKDGFSLKSCFDANKVFRKIPAKPVSPKYPFVKIFLRDILYDYLQGNFILQSTLLIRKDACYKFKMFADGAAIREQYEFCLRTLHELKVAFIDEVLVHRRFRGNNITLNTKFFHERTIFACQKAMQYPWMDARCRQFLTENIKNSFYALGLDSLKKGNPLEARRAFKQSLGTGLGRVRAKAFYLLTFLMRNGSTRL